MTDTNTYAAIHPSQDAINQNVKASKIKEAASKLLDTKRLCDNIVDGAIAEVKSKRLDTKRRLDAIANRRALRDEINDIYVAG